MSKTRYRITLVALAALLVSLVAGCPDPEGQYDEFLAATSDMRLAGDASTGVGVVTDFSGTFFLALSTSLGPGVPLYFLATANVDLDAGSIDIDFQPLAIDSNDDPRSPVGEVIEVRDIVYEADGTFVADMGRVEAPGSANPLTGRDIVAEIVLNGRVDSEMFFCGSVEGDLIEPAAFDLEGSTFAATAATLAEAGEITDVVFACPDENEGSGEGAQ